MIIYHKYINNNSYKWKLSKLDNEKNYWIIPELYDKNIFCIIKKKNNNSSELINIAICNSEISSFKITDKGKEHNFKIKDNKLFIENILLEINNSNLKKYIITLFNKSFNDNEIFKKNGFKIEYFNKEYFNKENINKEDIKRLYIIDSSITALELYKSKNFRNKDIIIQLINNNISIKLHILNYQLIEYLYDIGLNIYIINNIKKDHPEINRIQEKLINHYFYIDNINNSNKDIKYKLREWNDIFNSIKIKNNPHYKVYNIPSNKYLSNKMYNNNLFQIIIDNKLLYYSKNNPKVKLIDYNKIYNNLDKLDTSNELNTYWYYINNTYLIHFLTNHQLYTDNNYTIFTTNKFDINHKIDINNLYSNNKYITKKLKIEDYIPDYKKEFEKYITNKKIAYISNNKTSNIYNMFNYNNFEYNVYNNILDDINKQDIICYVQNAKKCINNLIDTRIDILFHSLNNFKEEYYSNEDIKYIIGNYNISNISQKKILLGKKINEGDRYSFYKKNLLNKTKIITIKQNDIKSKINIKPNIINLGLYILCNYNTDQIKLYGILPYYNTNSNKLINQNKLFEDIILNNNKIKTDTECRTILNNNNFIYWYINLRKDISRKKYMFSNNTQFILNRFEGVYGENIFNNSNGFKILKEQNIITDEELYNEFKICKGTLGCFISHIYLYKYHLIPNEVFNYYIILEDDIIIADNFESKVKNDILKFIDSDFDFIFIDTNPYAQGIKITEYIYKINGNFQHGYNGGTYCILASKKGLQKFINKLPIKQCLPIDVYIHDYMNDLEIYYCKFPDNYIVNHNFSIASSRENIDSKKYDKLLRKYIELNNK